MNSPEFKSSLAERLSDFLTYRRVGGMESPSQNQLLLYFDRFLYQEGFHGRWPTREVVERYLVSFQHLHAGSRTNRIPSCVSSVAICCYSNRSALFLSKACCGKQGLPGLHTSIPKMKFKPY